MIELLVVVSIISVLAYIALRVVGGVMTQARNSATETTIRKIHTLLDARAQGFYRLVQRKGFIESTPQYTSGDAFKLSQDSSGNPDRNIQRIIAIKALERQYFPQVSADTAAWPNPPPIFQDPNVSSGQLLYYVLTNDNLGADPGAADNFNTSEVSTKTNKNNSWPCFVDGWGNPIRFYRWPTRLFRPVPTPLPNPVPYPKLPNPPTDPSNLTNTINLTAAQVLFSSLPMFSSSTNAKLEVCRDPDDPVQRILRFGTQNTNSPLSNFETAGNGYHTPTTYHAMLVISAGPDGVLGLYEPEDIPTGGSNWRYGNLANPIVDSSYNLVDTNGNRSDALYDNITYLNVRAGGR